MRGVIIKIGEITIKTKASISTIKIRDLIQIGVSITLKKITNKGITIKRATSTIKKNIKEIIMEEGKR